VENTASRATKLETQKIGNETQEATSRSKNTNEGTLVELRAFWLLFLCLLCCVPNLLPGLQLRISTAGSDISETEHLIAAELIHPKLAIKSISFAHDRVKAPALGITAAQLDRHMSPGASVWWMPTTKEFGPKGAVFF